MSKAKDVKRKEDLINNFKKHEKDTGSSSVQIAIITDRINYLVDHLKQHKKRQSFASWPFKFGRAASSVTYILKA